MIGALPRELTIGGTAYVIRTDFRDVLRILAAFEDRNLRPEEAQLVVLEVLYIDWESIPPADIPEALAQAKWFLDGGSDSNDDDNIPVYTWTQDEQLIFSAVNKVAGCETRLAEYIHWWTFLGYFHEIGEGLFSTVITIRDKQHHGKKLEAHEKEFASRNRSIVKMRRPISDAERERKARLLRMLDQADGKG